MTLSYLGAMSVEDFFQLTLREIDDAIYYRNKAEESKLQTIMEVLRLQTYWDVNKYKRRGEKRVRKEILMMFPWDKKSPKRRFQTAKEMKNIMKAIARAYNRGDLKRKTTGRRPAKGIPNRRKRKK